MDYYLRKLVTKVVNTIYKKDRACSKIFVVYMVQRLFKSDDTSTKADFWREEFLYKI